MIVEKVEKVKKFKNKEGGSSGNCSTQVAVSSLPLVIR